MRCIELAEITINVLAIEQIVIVTIRSCLSL